MRKEYDLGAAKRGPVAKEAGKLRITIMLDSEILAAFRKRAENTGHGYQTLINQALSEHLANGQLEDRLRRVVRQELRNHGGGIANTMGE